MTKLFQLTGLAIVAALTVTAVGARELRAAPPAHPANGVLYSSFMKYFPEESEGRLTSVMLGPDVVNLMQMKEALQSNITEMGNILPLFFPADSPNMSMVGELALQGKKPQAMASALTKFMVTCAACQKEIRAFGKIYLG